MSSAQGIQLLQTLQTTYYVTAAAGALVAYDQGKLRILYIDLIWKRKWSFMTVLYLIIPSNAFAARVMCINWTYSVNVNIYLAVNWGSNIFYLSMQAILVIRVYALFSRSKKVLVFLSTLYVLQATTVFVMAGLLLNNRVVHKYFVAISPAYGSVAQIADVNPSAFFFPAQDSTILSVIFDAILLFFALWAFVRHASEAKKLDGGWSINVLVRTLVADHLVYFVCYLTWMSLSLASNYIYNGFVQFNNVLNAFNALAVVAGPRMVISLRAQEYKTRGVEKTSNGEMSTIQFGAREPLTQTESIMEEGRF
ncbi:hypothetical protein BJ138DRAFT_1147766 [Hygrophoropsis aurantiaca]|uniref:Uncharacterized protein n=1 Tax=Hygrophoropsis aurantiaca TaxID=72124 RepID=A0ACB8AHF5_9AGAM|nr:hypothetical protein BJ138DRAFT_1147766 [Hygrophoropsis aurantiaca]